MSPRRSRHIAWIGLLALLAGGLAGCTPEPPRPRAVTPSASDPAPAGTSDILQPPRRIATH